MKDPSLRSNKKEAKVFLGTTDWGSMGDNNQVICWHQLKFSITNEAFYICERLWLHYFLDSYGCLLAVGAVMQVYSKCLETGVLRVPLQQCR